MSFNYELSYQNIAGATREQAVQTEIISALQNKFKTSASYDHDTDGLMLLDSEANKYLLCEFKLDVNLRSNLERSKIILQSLFYLSKLERKMGLYPSVLLVADKNEFFILQTNRLNYYLSKDLTWEQSASTAYQRHPEVVEEISKDEKLQPYIYIHSLNSPDDFKDLVENVSRASEKDRKIRVSKFNIHTIFESFTNQVLVEDIGANKAVNIFMKCLLDPSANVHGGNKNIFLWEPPGKEGTFESIKVHGEEFARFWNHFDRENYPISEKQRLIAMSDEIIEETNRRYKGEYYTPSVWVAEAHQEIAKVFGENWKEEYVVWDCACGTGNLTRNYRFKELYMSTLNEEDLSQASFGNERATRFQFDFLNGDDKDLPKGLQKALKEDKVIFLINPPYAAPAAVGRGVAATKMNDIGRALGLGNSVKELYAQFFTRIVEYKKKNKNIHMASFSKATFLSGKSFKGFRAYLTENLDYKYGMFFNASEFSDTSATWGILFSVWE